MDIKTQSTSRIPGKKGYGYYEIIKFELIEDPNYKDREIVRYTEPGYKVNRVLEAKRIFLGSGPKGNRPIVDEVNIDHFYQELMDRYNSKAIIVPEQEDVPEELPYKTDEQIQAEQQVRYFGPRRITMDDPTPTTNGTIQTQAISERPEPLTAEELAEYIANQ